MIEIVYTKYDTKYSVYFCISWTFLVWILYILLKIQFDKISYYYYTLLIVTSCFKLNLKHIARQIDISTINNCYGMYNDNIHYNNKFMSEIEKLSKCISFELLMEIIVTMLYYYNYYQIFIYDLSNENLTDGMFFIKIIVLHLLTEMFQTVFCFSKLYFNLKSTFYQRLTYDKYDHDNCDNQKTGKEVGTRSRFSLNWFTTLCVEWLRDDSTFYEWKTRYSIDMTLRILSMMISFIVIHICLFTIGYKKLGIQNKNNYNRGILLSLIAFTVDTVYFIAVFVFNIYCASFNVWEPLLTLFRANPLIIGCMFFIASLLFVLATIN